MSISGELQYMDYNFRAVSHTKMDADNYASTDYNVTLSTRLMTGEDTKMHLVTTLGALDKIASTKLLTTVHCVAFASGFISLLASIFTLVYLFRCGGMKSFWKRKQGERMVVYLALSDLSFGAEHMSSHIMNIITKGEPPDLLCQISGFFFQLFIWTQAILVVICATSAFFLVTLRIKLGFGRYDYRLLLPAFILPFGVCCVYAFKGYLGPSGYWCYADIRKEEANIVYEINGIVMIIVAVVSGLLYLGVWIQIARTKKQLEDATGNNDSKSQLPGYHRTAKILVCFVVVYLAQWWPLVVYPIWTYFETPHIAMIILIVLFCNQGGVFNFFAYTFIRRIGRRPYTSIQSVPLRSSTNSGADN